ncbi:MAG: aminotransferase class V-fold PLP-dependent enzyme [Proteobacteria bacterium]|nr:aminotransferase class V-fold PLP-dependent enzyme [Pseudomonadota bacterium]
MAVIRGRQFFQNPGPTNIPDRILRAMDRSVLDFNGPEFRAIAERCTDGLKRVFKTEHAVLSYAASGHGAWEAALVNVLSPGDKVLALESGYFSGGWAKLGGVLGLEVEVLSTDWRRGADAGAVEARLAADRARDIKAVLLVHNETSTGVANRVTEVRHALDRADHPALFMVDVISSLASFDFRMDEWRVDVVVGGSQKGLMLPSGMSYTAASAKALKAVEHAAMPRGYWDWRPLLAGTRQARFPGTAPVHFFFGLQEALTMLEEEGLDQVFARHHKLAEATRAAVRAWQQNDGPQLFAADPRVYSDSVTSVLVPEGHDAEAVRRLAYERFNVQLGTGLGPLAGRVFRIGHMGDLNEPMLLGALAAVEMAMELVGVPHGKGGVAAAMASLTAVARQAAA